MREKAQVEQLFDQRILVAPGLHHDQQPFKGGHVSVIVRGYISEAFGLTSSGGIEFLSQKDQ